MILLTSSSFGISSSSSHTRDYFLKTASSFSHLSISVELWSYSPASIRVSTRFIFRPAFSIILSSIVLLQTSLNTLTSLWLPILWALSWAYSSIFGFQSESKMITVSAVCKLRPKPPALVLNIKTLNSVPGQLNSIILSVLSSNLVEPSSIKCFILL